MNIDLDLSPVLHIIVIGFHHQQGSVVQYCYPEFKSADLEKGLPVPWKSLLHLALPDGAHNHKEDFVFFTLPCLQESATPAPVNVFGVACFQQMASKDLKVKEDDITRATVQKSVVLILKLPLYGFILSKLSMITHAYFNQRDFSQTDILKDTYVGLSQSLSVMKLNDPNCHMGISLQDLVIDLKEKVLILLKLVLLERKIVFWGSPVGKVCMTIISLLSLFPGFFHNLAEEPSLKDQYGLPLDIFQKAYIFHPYLSLQQMDLLKSVDVKGFVVGTSNVLFKNQKHCLWDALNNLDKDEILIHDSHLCSQLSLTTEDLRFTEFISSTVAEHRTDSSVSWDGSDDWIRIQFKYYILCLLASTAPEKGTSRHIYKQFNEDFVMAWKETDNFKGWLNTKHSEIENIHQGHPFEGGLTISDLQLRIRSRIGLVPVLNDSRQRIGVVVQKTGQVVGSAYNSAKSALSSWRGWFTGIVEELNDEMRLSANNVETSNSNDEEVKELSEELDRGMIIPNWERIGDK